jgi:hypothetical protein
MTAILMMLALMFTGGQEPQEPTRVPQDSVELTVIGCLKGRVLSTVERQPGVERGIYVGERTFRLAGKKDVMDEVKRRNKQLVEVVGIVKRSSLDDKGVKSGRVTFSGGSPVAGRGGIPSPVEEVAVMDVSSVRVRATSCQAD